MIHAFDIRTVNNTATCKSPVSREEKFQQSSHFSPASGKPVSEESKQEEVSEILRKGVEKNRALRKSKGKITARKYKSNG